MSVGLYCGGVAFEAIDEVALACDAGGMKLTFGLRAAEYERLAGLTPAKPMQPRQVIELYDGAQVAANRAFYGLVYDAVWDNDGLWRVEARDMKHWLNDATLWGRSLQVAYNKRFGRVKYAYSPTAVSGGNLVVWTVGAVIQDLLNNMCGALAGETSPGVPTLLEYFSSTVVNAMKHDYSTGTYQWSQTIFAQINGWVNAVTSGTSSPWHELTLQPFGVQFDGESVGGAIDKLLKRYYPGWTWWVNPVTLVPAPLNVYGSDPTSVNTFDVESKQQRVLIDGLKRSLDGCWSRVIVQGQSASAVTGINPSSATWLPGWIIGGSVQISASGFIVYYVSGGGYVFTVQCTGYDPETQKLQVVRSPYGKFSTFSHNHQDGSWSAIFWDTLGSGTTGQQVGYRTDNVWLYDTGYDGTAHSVLDLHRTLLLTDETVGDAVLLPNTDLSGGTHTVVDRSTHGQSMATQVLARVKDIRYSGRMVVRGGPQFNPHLRVKVLHTSMGEVVSGVTQIIAVPHSVTWRLSTGEREYQLGDNEYNPFEELKLLNELYWRDPAHARSRYSAGGGNEAGNVPAKADDGSTQPPIT